MNVYLPTNAVKRITDKLKKLRVLKRDVNAVLLKTAQESRDNMINRITMGFDSNNKRFEPYTPAYAKKRAKSGRNLDSDRLVYTGNMLANYQAQEVSPELIVIAFTDDLQEQKAQGNQKKYKQFPMTPQEEKKARKALVVNLSLLTRKALKK